ADPDANIIFGAVIDESLKDEIRITVIATGFEEKAADCKNSTVISTPKQENEEIFHKEREKVIFEETAATREYDQTNLEVPAFLRRYNK
ncbi:MAG: cell division protein FtsZ, partial [Clostridium sp.]|nr:cell division protein FtsZ [Clostridium sp.]